MNDEQPGERLESWKKIAAYLKRDVRTVQRWEQTNGLPVHRLPRAQRPIPYAYKNELDAWWKRGVPADPPPPRNRRLLYIGAAVTLLLIAGIYVAVGLYQSRVGSAPDRSVAVLPFVDLSEGMANEEFADGLSEEIIDRLNRIPGLRVPAPTSTFYYKNRQAPVAEIGRSLRVAYVLDGSVRKTGDSLRVAARLIRVNDAAVVWSQSYDRTWSNLLGMQDEMAGAVLQGIEQFVRIRTSP